MADLDFNALLTGNRREADDFVNAAAWCKAFGKTWYEFERLPETRKFVKAYCEKHNKGKSRIIESKRGKGGGTFVHPVIAIKLAEWLSPKFEVFAKEVLQKFIKNPEDFAADILVASHNKERVSKAMKRVRVTLGNKALAELSQKHSRPFYKIHDDRAIGLFGMNTKQLREVGGIQKETPFNYMDEESLSYADAAACMVISADNPDLMALAASKIAAVALEITGKKLQPKFDEHRLTPSQARAIAYAPEYQMELPVAN